MPTQFKSVDHYRKLVAKLVVALGVGRVHGIEKRAELPIQRFAQPQIGGSGGKSRQDEIAARIADDVFPIDASIVHDGLKLFGWLAAPQPFSQDAGDDVEGRWAPRNHSTSNSDRAHFVARSRSP